MIAEKSPLFPAVIAASVVAVVAAGLLIYAAVLMLVSNAQSGLQEGFSFRLYLKLLALTVKNLPYSLVSLAIALSMCGAASLIHNISSRLLFLLFPYALTRLIVQVLLLSLIQGYTVYFLLNTADFLLERFKQHDTNPVAAEGANTFEKQALSKHGGFFLQRLPIPSIFLFAVAMAFWLINFPVKSDFITELEALASSYEVQSEMAYQLQMTDIAAIKSKKAYSAILAAEGYVEGLIAQSPQSTKADMEIYQNYDKKLQEALDFDRSNVWVYMLRGFLAIEKKDYGYAASQFKIALQGHYSYPDLYFGALESFRQSNDNADVSRIIEILIEKQIFRPNIMKTYKYSMKDLKLILHRLEDAKRRVFDNLALSAMEKSKYNDYEGMFNDIKKLIEKDPDNPSLLYLYG
ncbi:MAG: hypothetical protein N2Z57_08540, partial [Oscillospiraceae bacterium]|nr:hypothetical protein [Oscillospiraceae bacterium]